MAKIGQRRTPTFFGAMAKIGQRKTPTFFGVLASLFRFLKISTAD
jgi:hypothetical protein